jgi:hypothetical protein
MVGFGKRVASVLLLVMFVLSVAACMFVCAGEDTDHVNACSEQCSVDCLCQSVAVLPVGVEPIVRAVTQEYVSHEAPLKLRLIPSSIFNPPKV